MQHQARTLNSFSGWNGGMESTALVESGVLPKKQDIDVQKRKSLPNWQHTVVMVSHIYVTDSPLHSHQLPGLSLNCSVCLQEVYTQRSSASSVWATVDRFAALEGWYIFGGLSPASVGQGSTFAIQWNAFFTSCRAPKDFSASPPLRAAFTFQIVGMWIIKKHSKFCICQGCNLPSI